MKKLLLACAGVAAAVGAAAAGDIVYRPIDTRTLVVKPTRAAANVAAQTIDLVGKTAAGSIENNGYVKTINNLFSKKVSIPDIQPGPSALPATSRFPSTRYKNFNNPMMPTSQPVRRN